MESDETNRSHLRESIAQIHFSMSEANKNRTLDRMWITPIIPRRCAPVRPHQRAQALRALLTQIPSILP